MSPVCPIFAAIMQYGLEHYIVKLLAQHDCAIVPNLGGFVVQQESAQLLPDCIIPPHATVGFNPLLTHTDGHLAALIMRTEGVSNYRETAAKIEEQVSLWRDLLRQKQVLSLGELGNLRENSDGQLIFTPGNLDFLPANFGLAPIYRKQQTEERKPIVQMHRSYLRYAACAVLFLLCLIPPREANRYVDCATLDPTIWVRPTETVGAQIEQPAVSEEENTAEMVAEPSETTLAPATLTTQSAQTLHHHLIVASFDKSSAETYCAQLHSEGHTQAHVIPANNGFYRVAIQSYATRSEAIKCMESLRLTEQRFAKAWVFCE